MTTLVNKDNTFGAVFIGFAASSLCLGILSTQTYSYFQRYPHDKVFYKSLVGGLWLIEVADQVLIGHAVYSYLVSNWGRVTILFVPPIWSLVLQIMLGVVTGTIVKVNYAMRVWRFSQHNIPVVLFILLLTLGELGVAAVYTVECFQLKSLSSIGSKRIIGTLSLGIGMGTDVVIAAALCFFLRNLRTGFTKDDSLVNSLIIYAISTGGLTSVISLTTLILYNCVPNSFIYMAFYFVLSKVYANSFLAASVDCLNTRRVSRGRGTDAETGTMPSFLMAGNFTQRTFQLPADPTEPPAISQTKAATDSKSPVPFLLPATESHYADAW